MSEKIDRRRSMIRASACLALAGLVFVITGCGIFGGGGNKPAEEGEKKLRLTLVGGERLNTCGEEAGNALSVRILQLQGDGAVTGLGLTELWDHEQDQLGDELLAQQEVILDPGATVSVTVNRKPNTRFLVVAGSFCKAEGSCWRWIRPVSELRDSEKLNFGESCIREAMGATR